MYERIAPPRQKSCEACKTAKRRCDLAFPFCSRCVRRNEPCVYPGIQPSVFPDFDCGVPSLLDPPKDPWPVLTATLPYTTTITTCPPSSITPNPINPPDSQLGYANHASFIQFSTPRELIRSPNLDLATPRTRPLRSLSEIVASRLQFAIDILKDTPRMMVIENQTPWCHAHLYKHNMPKAMQGLYLPQ